MKKHGPNASTTNGMMRTMRACGKRCLRANTKMKESKYNASGTTHSNGIDARSVVICVVTPNIRLEGTKAQNIQNIIFLNVGGFWPPDVLSIVTGSLSAFKPFIIVTRHTDARCWQTSAAAKECWLRPRKRANQCRGVVEPTTKGLGSIQLVELKIVQG